MVVKDRAPVRVLDLDAVRAIGFDTDVEAQACSDHSGQSEQELKRDEAPD